MREWSYVVIRTMPRQRASTPWILVAVQQQQVHEYHATLLVLALLRLSHLAKPAVRYYTEEEEHNRGVVMLQLAAPGCRAAQVVEGIKQGQWRGAESAPPPAG